MVRTHKKEKKGTLYNYDSFYSHVVRVTCSENVSESNPVTLQVSLNQSDNVTAQPTMCVELDANMTYANNGLVL